MPAVIRVATTIMLGWALPLLRCGYGCGKLLRCGVDVLLELEPLPHLVIESKCPQPD
jgi:hypothetical protein